MAISKKSEHERAAVFAARHFRWNFGALVLDAASFWAGLTCFEATTILPVLLRQLHAPDAVIGLARFLQTLGFTLPALFAAHHIHGRTNHKRFLLTCCGIGRAGLLTLPPVLLLYGKSHPDFVVGWFLFITGLFWLTDGACSVSWFDIIAKTIPARVRGRFFGTMQMAGGLMALGAGFIVRWVLARRSIAFPVNFALLAALWFLGTLVSQICLWLIREPPGIVEEGEEKPPLGTYLKQAVPMLRHNRRLARLILTRVLLDGAGMAASFYILFARDDLRVRAETIGLYIVAQSVGRLSTGPLWGWLTDRFGAAAGLRAVGLAIALIPFLALVSTNGAAWLLYPVFFFMGAVQDGLWMVTSNALLESVDARERPLAIGVASVFQTPSSLYGVIGGLLAQFTSYPIVFGVALAFAGSGLLLALRLPRRPA
jgi:MFS family permease